MSNPIENGKILAKSDNKDLMIELRKAISANFDKVWIFVYYNNVHRDNVSTAYRIEVCNEWGSQLPKKKGEDVALFVNNWMKKNS
jgi:hypothetical protein